MAVKMDAETLQRLWDDFRQQPETELRNRLMENYLPLVRYNAERIWSRLPDGVELDDLVSAGVFGLMDAIEAFDQSRGVKFETYCVPRIRGAMMLVCIWLTRDSERSSVSPSSFIVISSK